MKIKKCKVENCENNIWKNSIKKGYCQKHYAQIVRNGNILERTRFDPNEIIDCGNYYEICLYMGEKDSMKILKDGQKN